MRIAITRFLRGGLRSGHYACGKYVGELLAGSKLLKISKLLLNVDKLKNFPQKKVYMYISCLMKSNHLVIKNICIFFFNLRFLMTLT